MASKAKERIDRIHKALDKALKNAPVTAGKPATHVPCDESREYVEEAIASGCSREFIVRTLRLKDTKMLRYYYADEIDNGMDADLLWVGAGLRSLAQECIDQGDYKNIAPLTKIASKHSIYRKRTELDVTSNGETVGKGVLMMPYDGIDVTGKAPETSEDKE